MNVPVRYDFVNAVIFLGGSRRLRRRFVRTLDVQPGHRVLELGCGSGQVTEQLVAAGAEVIAVDALPAMLARAAQRAPGVTFVCGDIMAVDVSGSFDRVVVSFVLHNFDEPGRRRVVRQSTARLSAGGAIGILDWALPRGRLWPRAWRRFLRRLEPSPTVDEILDGRLAEEVAAAGLDVVDAQSAAFGRTQILVAKRR